MYQYDAFDQRFVDERVAQYRDQTERYLDGKLSEEEFLQLRLRNGLYIQRLAPMLRVAVPYGTLNATQLRMLAYIARHYDREADHLTKKINTIIEPFMTIALAGIVLLVALSVFLPMWQMVKINH